MQSVYKMSSLLHSLYNQWRERGTFYRVIQHMLSSGYKITLMNCALKMLIFLY